MTPHVPAIRRFTTRQAIRARSTGFSLAELALVVVIMAILSAIAIPRFAAATRNSAVDQAARRLAGDLRLAQAEAIKTQRQQSVVIDIGTNAYTLVGMAHPDHPSGTFVVTFGGQVYRDVRISAVDFGGANILTFDRFGGPSSPGTVILGSTARTKTVRVAAGAGRITVE